MRFSPQSGSSSILRSFFAPLIGGLWGGIGATLIAVLLVWYIFLPPQFSMSVTETRAPISAAVVMASGIAFSLVLNRVRRRDEQLRTLFDMAGDGIAYVDATGRYLAVNERYCQMLGRARREIVGARLTDMPVGITPEFFAAVDAQLSQSGRVTFERQISRSDGTLLPVEVTAAPLRNHQRVSIVRDITERVQAEAATRSALQRLRLAQDAAQIGVFKWNFADDSVEWDDRACKIFGVSPGASDLARDIGRARIHPDDLAVIEAAFAQMRRTGEEWHDTFRVVLPDGQTRYIYSAAVVEHDLAGASTGMIGIHRDVTDEQMHRQFLEHAKADLELAVAHRTAQLQQTADELARANAGKDAFLAAISHELRTPLTGILGMAEALEAQFMGVMTAQQLRYVNHIRASGQRLLDLVNGVPLYASLMAGAVPVRTEVCRLLDLCAVSMRAIKEKAALNGQEILLDVESDDLAITSDPELITRALTLLLDNAVKFTGDNGMISILAERAAHEDVVQIVVWDTGIGIAADKMSCLFDPFTQVDQTLARRYEGIGVGLPTVRKLLNLLGGSIAVDSEPGKGSRFIVSLPVTPALADGHP